MEIIPAIIEALQYLNIPQLIVIGGLMYLIIPKLRKTDTNKLVHEAMQEEKFKEAQTREYVEEVLKNVYITSSNRASVFILNNKDLDDKEKHEQLRAFERQLKNDLDVLVYRMIINFIRFNHFHNLSRVDFEKYLNKRATELLKASRENIESHLLEYSSLMGTDELRWTLDETKVMLKDIFEYVKKLNKGN